MIETSYLLAIIYILFYSLIGITKQKPPIYSAVSVNGKRLYEYAREGIEVKDIYKEIEIYSIDLIDYYDDTIVFKACVSKGTYIRQLGSDIAKKLGTAGILSELERISIGSFTLDQTLDVEEISYEKLFPYDSALDFMPIIVVEGQQEKMVSNGMTVRLNADREIVLIKSKENKNLAVYQRYKSDLYKCLRGL